VQALLIRAALLLAAGVVLHLAAWVNLDVGRAVLSGLLAPNSAVAFIGDTLRLLALVVGLWLIHRGLR